MKPLCCNGQRKVIAAFLLSAVVTGARSDAVPWPMPFNASRSFGPDGPWHGMTLDFGWPLQQVDFYPSTTSKTLLISRTACESQDANCPLPLPKMYDPTRGVPLVNGTSTDIYSPDGWDSSRARALNLTGSGVDKFTRLVLIEEGKPWRYAENVTFTLSQSYAANYPDGTKTTLDVGLLALGDRGDSILPPLVNGVMTSIHDPISSLFNDSNIPSRSWGLHVGSVAQNVTPSLYFGGFDQSRVIGKVVSSDDATFVLKDIAINITHRDGQAHTSDGLLKRNQGGTGNGDDIMVTPDPGVPYLYLPQETCDSIAAKLPIQYNPSLGLYIWDSSSASQSFFESLTRSTASLAFTFGSPGDSTVSVNVPFSLLNLTLDGTFGSAQANYFPCRPYDALDGAFVLGRAFLQAAFLGQVWDKHTTFLAQAPGPKLPVESVKSLQPSDEELLGQANPVSWESTWEDVLSPTADFDGTQLLVSSASSSSSSSSPSSTSSRSSLSAGAKAGIAIGAVLGVILIGLLAWAFVRRRRQANAKMAKPAELSESADTPPVWAHANDMRDKNGKLLEMPGAEPPELPTWANLAEAPTGKEEMIERSKWR
ncbi:MAG: hypothetical protein M1817_004440 [Caeruleum heppii]|nr:MAG: hypothetical protein M1817_004440 [Caeruleum heppii]